MLAPGLGHLYSGEPRKALAIYFGWCGIAALVLRSPLWKSFAAFAGSMPLLAVGFAAIVISSVRLARSKGAMVLQAYNRWYLYGLVVVMTGIVMPPLLDRVSAIKTFYIPSGNMEPTMLVGDYVMTGRVDPRSVSLERGQIVTFYRATDSGRATIVSRIVALPGEVIEIVDKEVFIDDQKMVDPWGVHRDSRVFPAASYVSPAMASRDNFGPLTVPEGAVFVLGDNRDASHDSRFTGPVKVSDLFSNVLYVYWSRAGSGLGSVRWGRIGENLR